MSSTQPPDQHPDEPHGGGIAQRLNWLRASILGANDGIVSVAALVVGVAGATTSTAPILTAGIAALVGGAISMALGEYVSDSATASEPSSPRKPRNSGTSPRRNSRSWPGSTRRGGSVRRPRARWHSSSPSTMRWPHTWPSN